MRIAPLSIMAITAAAMFIAGSPAITAEPRGAGEAPLRPLSERDQRAAHGSGCQLSFDTARGTLVYVIGHEFVIRTSAGRTVCRIGDRQFARLSGGGVQSCGGYRLSIRRTGPAIENPETDSAGSPARLSVAGRGRPWTVRGHWGTAC